MKTILNLKTIWLFLILIYFTCFLSSGRLKAQNATDHHRKYWYYRSRLTNDFLKVGRGQGESIPFMQRGKGGAGLVNANPDLGGGDHAGAIGYYIAVLATEYKLLKMNGQNIDKVKHELFCALEAINRIDYMAETYYPTPGGQGNLNGFYIRDDFDSNFVKANYNHFNYYNTWDGDSFVDETNDPNTFTTDRGFASKLDKSVFKTYGSLQSFQKPNASSETTLESQDNTYNILFGLSFVNKFVLVNETDGNNTFGYGSGETSLTTEARNITKRLIDHIRNSKDLSGNDCLTASQKLYDSWRIRRPNDCFLVEKGDDARAFAYALGELESIMTGATQFAPITTNLPVRPQVNPGGGYHNVYSLGPGFNAWNITATLPFYNPSNPSLGMDTRVFITNLAAMCNCVYQVVDDEFVEETVSYLMQTPKLNWLGVIIGWIWKFVTTTISTFYPGYYTNTTQSSITLNAYPNLAPLDHGPIAHAVLHDNLTYAPNSQYTMDYLLDVAPCDNIYNFGANNKSHFQWNSDMRLDHPNRIGSDAGPTPGYEWVAPKGEYNGLDYMLYHNLHYLHKSLLGSINQNISDLSDVYINQPTGFAGNVNAYETVRITNSSLSNVNSTYWRAGKTISFQAGTEITGNNNLHAYIQNFGCATDIGQFRMINQDTTVVNHDSYPDALYHYESISQDTEVPVKNPAEDKHFQNFITELSLPENPIDQVMKSAYPEYSKELFVKPTITDTKVKAYFRMEETEHAFIHIMDASGKVILTRDNLSRNDTGMTIEMSDWSNGVYFLKFTTTKGTSRTQKIIKN